MLRQITTPAVCCGSRVHGKSRRVARRLKTRHLGRMTAKIGIGGRPPDTPAQKDVPPTVQPAPKHKAEETAAKPPAEIGGPSGPEPTRYGDWERNGRCIDF
jgi:hypothetical protein